MTNINLQYPKNISPTMLEALHDLPIAQNPWRSIAEKTNQSEQTILSKIQSFLLSELARNISPIFNAKALGYSTTLVAGLAAKNEIESAAKIISTHPGVSHNYLRESDQLNLWFTLAVKGETDALTRELSKLSEQTKNEFKTFDTIKPYKMSFRFNKKTSQDLARIATTAAGLDDATKKELAVAIKILHQGLKPVERPFLELANAADIISETELIKRTKKLHKLGLMRRLGVIWQHRKLGLTENTLCVWQIPTRSIDAFISEVEITPNITHCYQRTVYADWPWSIYTMIHGNNPQQLQATIEKLKQISPAIKYLPLKTLKEYKKSRVIYTLT
jgi:siroheme decarboxylase